MQKASSRRARNICAKIRRDALVAAAQVVAAVNRIAGEHAPLGRGTVGCLDVYPNSRNVIPGQVKLTVDFRNADDQNLLDMDAALRAAAELGYSHIDLPSGAAHDAVHLARIAPTAMIFVPCRDGISHNENKFAEPSHLEAAAKTLLRVLLDQAGLLA